MLETPYWPTQLQKYTFKRLSGKNMSESARESGYSPALVNQACNRIEPKAQLAIKEALIAKGIGTDRIAEVIEKGLNSTKPVQGFGIVPDYKERREHARLCLEALGELKTGTAVQVVLNMPSGVSDMLMQDSGEYVQAGPDVTIDGE